MNVDYQKQQDDFDKDGYLLLPDMASAEELNAMQDFCESCVSSRHNALDEGRALVDEQNNLLWIRCNDEDIEKFREAAGVLDRAWELSASLLGLKKEDISPKMRIFFKRPKCESEVPWHQDEAFYQRYSEKRKEGYNSINCWVSLDEATSESGCLKYIPGSHQKGLIKHKLQIANHVEGMLPGEQKEQDDQTGVTLYTELASDEPVVHATLPPGGMALHHCRTMHSSDSNRSANPRRAFVLVFQEKKPKHA